MRVAGGNGIEVSSSTSTIFLDPKRTVENSVVSHAHSDHLTPGARMTPPTLDFLRIRKPARSGTAQAYGETANIEDLRVTLHDAGHIFGSAMIEVQDADSTLLYTGDFNPRAAFTSAGAKPRRCDVLVTESTYGDPRFDLPPRELVLASLEAWTLRRLLDGPVALGAYPLGRAQELVSFANKAGVTPVVSPDIALLSAVYNSHGHDLHFAVHGSERARELEGSLHIVPREWLKKKHDFSRGLKSRGGFAAYLSGWCHRYSYFNAFDIDAQFALSDHASFHDILAFVEACQPREVWTTHGATTTLAGEIRRRLGLKATPLSKA